MTQITTTTTTTPTTTTTTPTEWGVNVWWHIPGFTPVGSEIVKKAVEANGFEQKDLPLPSRREVVRRACDSLTSRRFKANKALTEKPTDNGRYLAYGLLNIHEEGSDRVGYHQNTTIKLEKETGTVTVTGARTNEVYEAIAEHEDSIINKDIQAFLNRVVRMCFGIPKRPSGGIYFVPSRFAGIMESAQRVLNDLGTDARLYVERVVNDAPERKIVWEAVEYDIDRQIEDTLDAVEKIGKRVSAVQNHQSKVEELGRMMDIYRSLLGREAEYEELAERLKDASSQVAAKMAKLQNERTAKEKNSVADIVSKVSQVIRNAGRSLHYSDIANYMEQAGYELRSTKTKTKAQWLLIQINKVVRENPNALRKMGRGFYDVA
jgi:hypothetical protein